MERFIMRCAKGVKEIVGSRSYYAVKDGLMRADSLLNKHGRPYSLIKNNKELYNIHRGERCFILGNGPSLREIDFRLLKNEYVFSVNYFNLVDGYRDVKTNVHLWMDMNTFGMRPEAKEDPQMLKRNFREIGEENPLCFVPIQAYPFVKKYKLDDRLRIRYLHHDKDMLDEKITYIDLTKGIYTTTTVVQYAIQVAIYMGFSKIYLLGCDSTNIITHLNTILGMQNTSLHAYDSMYDNAEDATKSLMKTWKTYQFIYDHYIIFHGYDILEKYCQRNHIDLINCSGSTLITEIPRRRFDDVI